MTPSFSSCSAPSATGLAFFRAALILTAANATAVLAGATPQVGFVDRTSLLQGSAVHSGVAMGVADMNGDGRDDVVRLHDARDLRVEYQGAPNGIFGSLVHGSVSGTRQWGLCIADVDHNGFRDIYMGGAYDGSRVLFANSVGTAFSPSTMPGPTFFTQGVNFADLDGDGWLDIFACHDNAESHKYRNNGSGGFEFTPGLMDTTTTPSSDNSGNYGSVFTDYDGDGDMDLYISKCRQGVSSSTDPRRINMLLRNDGQTWTQVSDVSGLDLGEQSWTADFGDLDGDGDMDVFVVNHYDPSVLLENRGDGVFVDVTAASGLAGQVDLFGIQTAFRDFDNDGNLDLLVSGSEHRLFVGDGALGFTRVTAPFPGSAIESFALGDLNSDGFVDVYAGYANLFNGPSAIPDKLFMNAGNSNGWLQVTLEGTSSNRDGVGARLELTNAGKLQVREVRAGESYGVSHSLTRHFGVGTAQSLDRLRVTWPSGIVDELLNVDVNQRIHLVEGSTAVRNVIVATLPLEVDDGEESEAGIVWRRNRDLELVNDGTRGDQVVGLRFSLDVPQGATVVDAWIQFTAEGRDFSASDLRIAAEAVDDAPGIRSGTSNLSLRQRTDASVQWTPPSWTLVGRRSEIERTPSLRSVVQEVINRDGWAQGQHALFLVTGTGRRQAYSSDAGLSIVGGSIENPNAPRLHVQYSNRHVATSAVDAAGDDAEERVSGYVILSSPDLELVDDGAHADQVVALQFGEIAVPPGATIDRAYLQFTADETGFGDCALVVHAQASGAPSALAASSDNLSARPLTVASVAWPVLPWTHVGDTDFAQRSPDLSSLVQELVDRGDWSFNTDAVFLITGDGTRTAESFEGGAAKGASLFIEFSTGAGNDAPYVDAGDDISISGTNTARLSAAIFDELYAPQVTWTMVSGRSQVTFSDASRGTTSAVFGSAGVFVLRVTVDDGTHVVSDDVIVTVSGVGMTQIIPLATGGDDAEESDTGSVWRGNSDLELVDDGDRGLQTVGLRFTGLNVPQGATITSATIQFTADETDTTATSLVLRAEAADDAAVITGATSSLSGRPTGAVAVSWSPGGWGAGTRGPSQRTPNLATVLQEVTDRAGWGAGHAVLFVVTGTGKRVAQSFDGNQAGAAVLTVTYQ